MFTVCAIKSLIHKFIYVGMTEKPEERLVKHNKGYVRSTKRYAPFKLIYSESVNQVNRQEIEKNFSSQLQGNDFLNL